MNGHRFRTIAVVALLLLSGCLPYSCRRQESTALTPADSLSRTLASSIPMDTLALAWARPIGDDRGAAYPRTVRFGHAQTGPIYLGDAEQALVFVFDLSGEPVDTFATASIPYLAGVRGDTVAVFEPGAPAMHFFVRGAPVGTVPIQDAERSQTALVYGAFGGTAGHHAIYYKRVDPEAGGFVAEIDPSGNATTRWPLPGPHWRHAGVLRFLGRFAPEFVRVSPRRRRDRARRNARHACAAWFRLPDAGSQSLLDAGRDPRGASADPFGGGGKTTCSSY